MKPSTRFFLIPCATLLFFTACQKDNTLTETSNLDGNTSVESKSYANVPVELWDYFERFENEASLRGENIDLSTKNLTAEIMEITENGVAGTCSFSSHEPNHIVIDQSFFNQTSDLFKEMVIFHELGHCVLFRGHREDSHPNGTCVSIMRSGIEGCRDNYRNTTRPAYLNELFGEVN